jgi:hypothetical protein
MDATDGKSALTQRGWLLRVVGAMNLDGSFSAGELHPDLSDGIKIGRLTSIVAETRRKIF